MTSTASPITRSISDRFDGVDMLRGLAIFFVLMNHVNMRLLIAKVPYTAGIPDQVVSSLVWNGQRGVQIFFAISGFLITSISIRRWDSLSKISLRGFYVMRFARIAPLLFLLLGVLSALHFAHVRNFVVSADTGGLWRALFAALTFHVNVLETSRGYLPGNWDILWSLSVEEVFYLFFPIVARLFGRGKLLIVILLGFVTLGPFARTVFAHGNEVWKEYSYWGGMDAIALGCLTALCVLRFRFSRMALWALGTVGTMLLVFSLCFSLRSKAWGLERTGLDMTILAVGACMVIAATTQTNWKSPRVMSPLLALGRRSYEVYLTHMFVVFGLFQVFTLIGKPMSALIPLFTAVIVIAGFLGEGVARLYSEPLNHLIRERWRDTAKEIERFAEPNESIGRAVQKA